MDALALAIQAVGTQQALAEKLGIRSASISEWKSRNRVPAERVLDVESATGVSRHDLRPDIFPPEWRIVPVAGSESGAKVDLADYGAVAARHWYAVKRNGITYAESAAHPQIMLHRFIFGDSCKGRVVDHINGDGLDNRRANLRVCTQRENSRNRKAVRGYRGVSWKADIGKWRARIMVDRKEIALGVFDTAEAAAEAYDAAAIQHFGEFAKLNFGPAPDKAEAA